MSHSKVAELILKLQKKTKEGQLDWTTTDDEECFEVTFPNYAIQIWIARGPFIEGEDVVIGIYDNNGDLLERVSDEDMSGDLQIPYKIMKDLWEAARRKAQGIDAALDNILMALDDDEQSED